MGEIPAPKAIWPFDRVTNIYHYSYGPWTWQGSVAKRLSIHQLLIIIKKEAHTIFKSNSSNTILLPELLFLPE